ncbi:MAG: endonuclease MutS2, partial [Clostridia bacterium]|nr:endonuclease MutS2 [Clostridia bacterium]
MNQRSAKILEFDKIRNQLAENCVSESGKAIANELQPSDNLLEVEQMLRETEEARSIMGTSGSMPVPYFTNPSNLLHLARIGGTLPPKGLMDIAQLLRAARTVKEMLMTDREDVQLLSGLAMGLSELRQIERDISNAIISEDEIADQASPELASIRRKKRSCNDRVRERLNSLIHSATYQKYLQEAIITVRADRYVLPVRQEYRSMVPGIVHDQSSSGATIFIEPMSVVEIGNELKQLTAAEKVEIDRILLSLSAQIAPEAQSIENNIQILSKIDFIFAKGLLGQQMEAVTPRMNAEGRLDIRQGRHPLIAPQQVVPLDIRLGKDYNTLIITGPNTGGKTVTLKTTGLFSLMAQSGLQIPAEYDSEMTVFDEIFADIGDEQSIEQSLSTFSGHMKNIVNIMENVKPGSLVLFDELGAGTDPTEGAALAQAILTSLLKKHVRTVATTHYSELKEFAMLTPEVENASVEFDVATLRPTYKLLIGIPGKSNAFEISKKLGLSDELIEQARALLSKEQIHFEDVLASAEYHRQLAKKEQQLAEEAHADMEAIRSQAEKERKQLEAQRERSIQKAKAEAKRIIENARREQESLIEELRALKKAGGAQEHEIQQIRKKAEQSAEKLMDKQEIGGEPLTSVKVGEFVH